jgi:long-subunit acyl-CoA synthetase (AMP-forming)
VRELYGMTETGPAVCYPADAIRSGSLGKALSGVEVRVVDLNGTDASNGQIGVRNARAGNTTLTRVSYARGGAL